MQIAMKKRDFSAQDKPKQAPASIVSGCELRNS